MKKKSAAFTLMEIIIVLVIFAAILGIGIFSISQMSKSTMLSEATGDALSILKETQNMAKNNTLPKVVPTGVDKTNSVFYFILEFKSAGVAPYGNINRYIYARKNGTWTPSAAIDTEQNLKSRLITEGINYSSVSNPTNPQPLCKYVMFEALSGKIMIYTATGAIVPVDLIYQSTAASCQISVSLAKEGTSKYLYVNAANGNFGIQGETN